MKRFLAATALTFLGVTAGAEEPPPLNMVVRPSASDPVSPQARQRQELLMKRMDSAQDSLRNICTRCGGIDRANSDAPFYPMTKLRGQTSQF